MESLCFQTILRLQRILSRLSHEDEKEKSEAPGPISLAELNPARRKDILWSGAPTVKKSYGSWPFRRWRLRFLGV